MKKRVLIAADVDPSLIDRLKADPRFEVRLEFVTDEEMLTSAVKLAEVLITRAHNRVTGKVLAAATDLQLIAQGTSGVDNIDEEAARVRNIALISLPGENANAVAEFVIGQMIALTRTIPFYHRSMVERQWLRNDCATRSELRAHRLGIVGLGRVGGRVSALAAGFGIIARAFDPYLTPEVCQQRGATKIDSFHELLGTSDVVSFHVPLTGETRGMLGETEVSLLPRGAVVINASRGEVTDIDALLKGLESGHLGGLALDVYESEPPDRRWPDTPRLILTPHIAGCSRESKQSIGESLYRRICGFYGFATPDK